MSVIIHNHRPSHPDSRYQASTIENDVVESDPQPPLTQTPTLESSAKRVHFSPDTRSVDTFDYSAQLPTRVKQYLDSVRDVLSATDDLLSTKKVRKHFWSSRKYPDEASKRWYALGRRSDRSLESVISVSLGLIREWEAARRSHETQPVINEARTAVRQEKANKAVHQTRRALEITYPQTRFTAFQLSAASNLETTKERSCFIKKRAYDIARNIQVRMGDSVGDVSSYESDFATSGDRTMRVKSQSGDFSLSDLVYIRQLHREMIYAWRTEVGYVSSKSG